MTDLINAHRTINTPCSVSPTVQVIQTTGLNRYAVDSGQWNDFNVERAGDCAEPKEEGQDQENRQACNNLLDRMG